jgi:hypothetical protein
LWVRSAEGSAMGRTVEAAEDAKRLGRAGSARAVRLGPPRNVIAVDSMATIWAVLSCGIEDAESEAERERMELAMARFLELCERATGVSEAQLRAAVEKG